MDAIVIKKAFEDAFDVVGIIRTSSYLEKAISMGKRVPEVTYPTMVVVGLSYPMRVLKHTNTHLVPSFYTFGRDYHQVLKDRIKRVADGLNVPYVSSVDNHPHDERLAAVVGGLGFFGKNQLIISENFGSYMFLGMVFLDCELDREIVLSVDDSCGTCRKCIDACPVSALSEEGFDIHRCMSQYNQSKRMLSDDEMKANYALFGCDICQMVCPKNVGKGMKVHPEFELSGKEMVSIIDLLSDSENDFVKKYQDMAYLWKGKTVLMRNALMLLDRQKNTRFISEIENTLKENRPDWYKDVARKVLMRLTKHREDSHHEI